MRIHNCLVLCPCLLALPLFHYHHFYPIYPKTPNSIFAHSILIFKIQNLEKTIIQKVRFRSFTTMVKCITIESRLWLEFLDKICQKWPLWGSVCLWWLEGSSVNQQNQGASTEITESAKCYYHRILKIYTIWSSGDGQSEHANRQSL